MSIKPVFSFSIDMKLSEKGVSVGKYDGETASLTAITQSNKTTSKIEFAITAGKLSKSSENDYLAIGSDTNILVYQVNDNLEVFFKEITEGVLCMIIGTTDDRAGPMLFCGSKQTVRGFNEHGDEILWIVTSCFVNSIELFDFNRDNELEIILGCENEKIKIYKNDKFIRELNESGPIKKVIKINSLLAFILKNGTIGIYEGHVRLWRIKAKSTASSAASYDILGTGHMQLVIGWESGKIDVRDPRSGDVLMKMMSSNKIIGLLVTDYRGLGSNELISISEQGDIQGYMTSSINLAPISACDGSQISEMLNLKQNLLTELIHYENNLRVNDALTSASDDSLTTVKQLRAVANDFAIIPANTRLSIGISADEIKKSSVEVSISTNNSTIIKAVIVFTDGIFPNGEVLIVHPPTKRVVSGIYSGIQSASSRISGVSNIVIPLKIPKDEVIDVHIKAFVGSVDGNQFHVFELNRQLPKFSMYSLPEKISGSPKGFEEISKLSENFSLKAPESFVKFKVAERVSRFCMFINQNFLLPADIEPPANEIDSFDFLKLSLVSLRDASPVIITFYNDSNIIIQTENLELAGNLVQSIAEFMNITNLDSSASFPGTVSKFHELFEKLQGLQESANVLRTDTALKINLAKILVIRAEDAKITNMAQRLRVGNVATKMMTQYKEALLQKNVEKLVQIMEMGK
ncbi:CLUMA_CG000236, isoform A [Clunio marinus]|uniref:Bardet-Biedl syndrome 2 protein homolog n=1 Tax=Clunio marinus TaxID=568069 RepID=A0A1J1HF20_9DIPT|nr:CLUMA_CG000236, isoform A [Clunio marinus]